MQRTRDWRRHQWKKRYNRNIDRMDQLDIADTAIVYTPDWKIAKSFGKKLCRHWCCKHPRYKRQARRLKTKSAE